MKKWTKMLTLYSVAMLASASSLTAFADETVTATSNTLMVSVETTTNNSTDNPAPIDPAETPTVPSDATGGDGVTPTDPNATIPTEPSTTEPTEPPTVTQPSDTPTPPTDGVPPTEPSQTTTAEPSTSTSTTDPSTSTSTTEPSTTAPTPPTTSPKTEPQPSTPQLSTPVQTQSGHVIVGTQNGNVVVQASDGRTQVVPATSVGGTLENDGTITVTDKEGKLTRLPNTGAEEAISAGLSLAGILLLFSTLLWWRKRT